MECVHCTACLDACDSIMDRIRRPRGLIRYASLNGIEKREPLRVTPRIIGYSIILLVLGALLLVVLLSRSDVDTTLLRAPGSLFQQTSEGRISNLYILKLVNKTSRDLPVELRLEEPDGKLTVIGGNPTVPAQQLTQTSVLVELPPDSLAGGTRHVRVGVYSEGRLLSHERASFLGPRRDTTTR